MEHLALEVFDRVDTGSKYAVLAPDATITITATSEIFANGDVWSYDFKLNVHANAQLFGTAGDIHGSRLHEQINKRKARLWVEGVPLYLGYLKLGDEAEVDAEGNVDVSFESGQKTFEELIEGAKANQVPLMSDVLIGMALWPKREVDLKINVRVNVTIKEGAQYDIAGRVTGGQTIAFPDANSYETINVSSSNLGIASQYPRMVFPKGVFAVQGGNTPAGGVTVNQLNTDTPYDDGHPYCNTALCYQAHGYPTKNGEVDYSAEEQAIRGYDTMPANRVNSAPNFFVLYWLKCLMKHIGINIEENQLLEVEDMRRLFFVNTNCAYEVPAKFDRTGSNVDKRYGCFTTYQDQDYVAERFEGTVDVNKSKLNVESFKWEYYSISDKEYYEVDPNSWGAAAKMEANVVGQIEYTDADKENYVAKNRRYHYAYATKDCFPNVDVSEVLNALKSGFGVRFLFGDNYQRVRIVLLRNIFRSEEIQDVVCDIVDEDIKIENNKRGFRMTYGDKKDDTTFYYKGFADKLAKANEIWADDTDKHDYSHWNLNADYATLINNISAFDKTCYVTPNNGDAYGIKIDKDAKAYKELHPSLFEYAGYMDAEDGDCTGEPETIEEVQVGFVPAIVNDVNFEEEKLNGTHDQQFALFVNEEMRSRRADKGDLTPPASYNDSDAVYKIDDLDEKKKKLGLFSVNSDMPIRQTISGERRGVNLVHDGHQYNLRFKYTLLAAGYINEGFRLYLQDNYEPNDDGISPIEKHDWGLTLGIMRGIGSDAYVNYSDDPDDGEGNQTWDIVPGSSTTAHPDTCDNYGNLWEYNLQTVVDSPAKAIEYLQTLWPDSNLDLVHSSGSVMRDESNCIYIANIQTVNDDNGNPVNILLASDVYVPKATFAKQAEAYAKGFNGMNAQQMRGYDMSRNRWLIEVGSSEERMQTLLVLEWNAFVYYNSDRPIYIDNGVGSRYGRFSLKLRAEKLNPYFDPKQAESENNRRYLEITNENLQGRGLCDQFYKEYSYWVRNARIVKRTVRMTLAQLLTIDKTKRVRVGDVTGFIRKMQYSVSNQSGLGTVTMEIMYI